MNVTEVVRGKLARRLDRIMNCDNGSYGLALRQFWNYINRERLFSVVLRDAMLEHQEMQAKAETPGREYDFVDERQEAAFYAYVIQDHVRPNGKAAYATGNTYISKRRGLSEYGEGVIAFSKTFVQPLALYLEEALDDARIVLALLLRYKQKCEWFQRERLRASWSNDTQRGEAILAAHLQEYLHDCGLDVFVEPATASGRPDFVICPTGTALVVADAKVYKGGSDQLARGFHQVCRYLRDLNEVQGYLAVFKVDEVDLHFDLQGQSDGTPYFSHAGRTVFFVTIDIAEAKSASKRPVLKTVTVTESDLLKIDTERLD